MPQEQTRHEARNYHRTQMKRELIIQKLREQGCRITRQRRILLDIILEEECSCCKEIAEGQQYRTCYGVSHGEYAGEHRRNQPKEFL